MAQTWWAPRWWSSSSRWWSSSRWSPWSRSSSTAAAKVKSCVYGWAQTWWPARRVGRVRENIRLCNASHHRHLHHRHRRRCLWKPSQPIYHHNDQSFNHQSKEHQMDNSVQTPLHLTTLLFDPLGPISQNTPYFHLPILNNAWSLASTPSPPSFRLDCQIAPNFVIGLKMAAHKGRHHTMFHGSRCITTLAPFVKPLLCQRSKFSSLLSGTSLPIALSRNYHYYLGKPLPSLIIMWQQLYGRAWLKLFISKIQRFCWYQANHFKNNKLKAAFSATFKAMLNSDLMWCRETGI